MDKINVGHLILSGIIICLERTPTVILGYERAKGR